VIGADGGGSKVRRLLLGSKGESTILPFEMNNFNCQYTKEQALFIRKNLATFTDIGIHPKGFTFLMSLLDVPDPDDPSTWNFQLLTSYKDTLLPLSEEENTSENRLKVLKDLSRDHAEPRKSAMAWIPKGHFVPRDRLAIWSPIPWDNHNGRVTLAGDAAHSMTNHRGQGLNNCFNDAGNFVAGLIEVSQGTKTLVNMLKIYDEEVVKRGATEVLMSQKQSLMMHDWEMFLQSPVMQMGNLSRLGKAEGTSSNATVNESTTPSP